VADETPGALETRSRYHHAVSLRFDKPEHLAAARREIAGLAEVGEVETEERELKLTAVPRAGKNVLPAVSALIAKYDWDVPELHLESGRLDEVFRTLTGAVLRGPAAAMPDTAPGEGGARL
jgi:ABC-2 type transport system ATP-binding protein